MMSHYISIIAGYSLTVLLWFGIYKRYPHLWNQTNVVFKKPGLEFVLAMLCGISILGIGQLYVHNLLIPNNRYVVVDALNQVLIFSPVIVLLIIRKQSLKTIWLTGKFIPAKIALGLCLSIISLLVYHITKENARNLWALIANIYHFKNLSHLVQVFLEDITIALVFVRLSAWIGNKRSIFIIPALFAIGHIPSMLSSGLAFRDLNTLLLDTALAIMVVTALSKSKDIWWFFPVHFAMDMTQYYGSINN